MKPETSELLKLIKNAPDPERAILIAYAITLDFLSRHESSLKASAHDLAASLQKYLPS